MKTVVIDPGHGSAIEYDYSFIGTSYEQHEGINNYKTAELLKSYLLTNYDVNVVMTRTTIDSNPTLSARGSTFANADLFFSLHSNFNPYTTDGVKRGSENIYAENRTGSYALGNALQLKLNTSFGIPIGEDFQGIADGYTVVTSADDAGCKKIVYFKMEYHDNTVGAALLINQRTAIANAMGLVIAQDLVLPAKGSTTPTIPEEEIIETSPIIYPNVTFSNTAFGTGGTYPTTYEIMLKCTVLSQNVVAKTSLLSITASLEHLKPDLMGIRYPSTLMPWYIRIDGATAVSNTGVTMSGNRGVDLETTPIQTIATFQKTISHTADGSKSLTLSAYQDTNAASAVKSFSVSLNVSLPKIQSASTFTSLSTNIDDLISFNIKKSASVSTHDMEVYFGSTLIATKTNLSGILVGDGTIPGSEASGAHPVLDQYIRDLGNTNVEALTYFGRALDSTSKWCAMQYALEAYSAGLNPTAISDLSSEIVKSSWVYEHAMRFRAKYRLFKYADVKTQLRPDCVIFRNSDSTDERADHIQVFEKYDTDRNYFYTYGGNETQYDTVGGSTLRRVRRNRNSINATSLFYVAYPSYTGLPSATPYIGELATEDDLFVDETNPVLPPPPVYTGAVSIQGTLALTTAQWTTLYNLTKTVTSFPITLRLKSKLADGYVIGTSDQTITITYPASIIPTLTDITFTETSATTLSQLGAGNYLANVSSLNAQIIGMAGVKGSTIYAPEITTPDGVFPVSIKLYEPTVGGIKTFKARVKDSRNRWSDYRTETVTIGERTKPRIYSYSIQRVNADGTPNPVGLYFAHSFSAQVFGSVLVNGLETNLVKFRIDKVNKVGWYEHTVIANIIVDTLTSHAVETAAPLSGPHDITEIGDYKLTVTDIWGSETDIFASMGFTEVAFTFAKTGMGIGGVFDTTEPSNLQVFGDANFNGELKRDKVSLFPSILGDGISLGYLIETNITNEIQAGATQNMLYAHIKGYIDSTEHSQDTESCNVIDTVLAGGINIFDEFVFSQQNFGYPLKAFKAYIIGTKIYLYYLATAGTMEKYMAFSVETHSGVNAARSGCKITNVSAPISYTTVTTASLILSDYSVTAYDYQIGHYIQTEIYAHESTRLMLNITGSGWGYEQPINTVAMAYWNASTLAFTYPGQSNLTVAIAPVKFFVKDDKFVIYVPKVSAGDRYMLYKFEVLEGQQMQQRRFTVNNLAAPTAYSAMTTCVIAASSGGGSVFSGTPTQGYELLPNGWAKAWTTYTATILGTSLETLSSPVGMYRSLWQQPGAWPISFTSAPSVISTALTSTDGSHIVLGPVRSSSTTYPGDFRIYKFATTDCNLTYRVEAIGPV